MSNTQTPTGFKDLLNSMMSRRWYITALVLGGFMFIMAGMFFAIFNKSEIAGEWKELLLLLLGAFIGSYGKIIDYWFSDTDKDKMLVQKMDEEDGTSLSNTADLPNNPVPPTPIIPVEFGKALSNSQNQKVEPVSYAAPDQSSYSTYEPEQVESSEPIKSEKKGTEIDEDGDGVADGLDYDGDGTIDEYFPHRYCQHVWGDANHDGQEECQICGLLRDNSAE